MNNSIPIKSSIDVKEMREAGRILAGILKELEKIIAVGVSAKDVEQEAETLMRKHGVRSAFKGYRGYPASICVSVNEEVIHGIPREDKTFKEGDAVSIDMGIVRGGYFVDAARTCRVGNVARTTDHLVETARKALDRGIERFQVGNHLGDISSAIEQTVVKEGFSVVREFVGHGIGRSLHEEPAIPNYGNAHEGIRLEEGMVFAIEPMVNEGRGTVTILDDGWTAVTADRRPSAHFEHTVALTSGGPVILTAM